jgi:large subunit ribosomal protein L24
MSKIRKGDQVKVLSGNSAGKIGKVLMVDPDKQKVIVEGVNLLKRHSRPSQRNPKGGIIEKEGPIHMSKVMLYDGRSGQATRVGFHVVTDDKGNVVEKVRVSKKSGEVV